MKTSLIILVTAGVTFAAMHWLVSSQQSSQYQAQLAAAEARWQSEKAGLEFALADAQNKPAAKAALPAKATRPGRLSPREILDKLIALKPGNGPDRNRTIRLVVYYLESLADCGPDALSVIRDFLAQNQDIDYTAEDNAVDPNAPADPNAGAPAATANNRQRVRNNNNLIWSFRRGGELRTDFVLPPSLRLGLVDVLKNIGGADAEKTLASVLEGTGRGIEVDYVAKVLEEMAPGKYRDLALTAAKDLLTHPPAIDSPNRMDDLAEGYLYDVLRMYNDTSFAATAQMALVGADGRIDRNALAYLSNTLKDQAIPALYQAYLNPNLTNQMDKMQLAGNVLNYAGQNPTANQLLTDIVGNTNLDSRMRAFTVARLAGGGFGPFTAEAPTDPQVIQARLQLAINLLAQTTEPRVSNSLGMAIVNLNHLANGEPVENNFGGGGQRRGRGGPGN